MLRKLFSLTLFMAVVASFSGFSQTTNTASANADAEMSLPIAISAGTGLHFGGFMPGATPGTVVVPANPNQARYASGGVTLVAALDREIGEITVAGNPNATYTFTLPSEPVSIKLISNQAIQMTLSNITYYASTGSLELDNTGSQYVTFGGTLNVAADQLKGDYYGSFEITAAYQ